MPQGANRAAFHVDNIANTFYVDDALGNDSTGTGAIGAPWKTLNKAYTYLRDTHVWAANQDIRVYIRGGTYQGPAAVGTAATLDPQFNGAGRKPTATQWVIWEAFPGETVIIKPPADSGAPSSGAARYGVRCTSTGGFVADFQSWRRLTFDGEGIIKGDGDVVGLYLSNNTGNNEIIDCVSKRMRANYIANGGAAARKAQGFYVDPNANNNRFLRCKSFDIGANLGTIDAQEHGYYCSGDNVKFYDCAAWDCPNGYGLQVYDGGAISTGIEIVNCTIAGSFQKSCIVIHGNATNARIAQNILKGATEYGIEFFPVPSGSGSGNILDRNVIQGNSLGAKSHASPAGWTETNLNTNDPQFASFAGRDFHLTGSSPALGLTDTNWAGATDVDGVARTSGSEDAGAWEYVAVVGTSSGQRLLTGVGD